MKKLEHTILENKEELLSEFPHLTEKDFDETDEDELLVHLTQKLGKTKEELREMIRNL